VLNVAPASNCSFDVVAEGGCLRFFSLCSECCVSLISVGGISRFPAFIHRSSLKHMQHSSFMNIPIIDSGQFFFHTIKHGVSRKTIFLSFLRALNELRTQLNFSSLTAVINLLKLITSGNLKLAIIILWKSTIA